MPPYTNPSASQAGKANAGAERRDLQRPSSRAHDQPHPNAYRSSGQVSEEYRHSSNARIQSREPVGSGYPRARLRSTDNDRDIGELHDSDGYDDEDFTDSEYPWADGSSDEWTDIETSSKQTLPTPPRGSDQPRQHFTAQGTPSNEENVWASTSRSRTPKAGSHGASSNLCIICEKKPAYSKSQVRYPTCGLTCAAKLDSLDHKHSSSSPSSTYPGPCLVCGLKQRHIGRNGRRYPTCGLTCASNFKPSVGSKPNISGMCNICHKRAKRTFGALTFDQCGRKCRDEAKSREADLVKAMSGTCTYCLGCWMAPAISGAVVPYCSRDCKMAMLSRSPTMVEIPRGHALFDKYNALFESGWKLSDSTSSSKPVSRHMYFFCQGVNVLDRYVDYRRSLDQSLARKKRVATESELWYSVSRECNTGDSGITRPCSSKSCALCSFMLNSFSSRMYSNGITASLSACRASKAPYHETSDSSVKVLLFFKVYHAERLPDMSYEQIFKSTADTTQPPVVKPFGSRDFKGFSEESIHIFNLDAVLPLGVLIYS